MDLALVFLADQWKEVRISCILSFCTVTGVFKPAHHFLQLLVFTVATLSVVKYAHL